MVILFKIWPKIGQIGIWMGYFFLKNWCLYGSTFKFCGGTSLPKPNLSTPGGLHQRIITTEVSWRQVYHVSMRWAVEWIVFSLISPTSEICTIWTYVSTSTCVKNFVVGLFMLISWILRLKLLPKPPGFRPIDLGVNQKILCVWYGNFPKRCAEESQE